MPKRSALSLMAAGAPDLTSKEARNERMIALRRTFTGENQAAFARLMGFSARAWNNYERGYRIGIDHALVLCARTGVSLDWIYRGIESPGPLMRKIAEASKRP